MNERSTSARSRKLARQAAIVQVARAKFELLDTVFLQKGAVATARREVTLSSHLVVVGAPGPKEASGMRQLLLQLIDKANTAGFEPVLQAIGRALQEVDAKTRNALVEASWEDTEAKRWAEIRTTWLMTYRSLTAAEVARMAGSDTVNSSSFVKRWVDAKRVFAVPQGHHRLYPAFQLGCDGRPKPIFRRIIEILGETLSGWALAIWLTSPNSQLECWAKPLDLIDRAPDAVIAAAQHQAAEASY